MMRLGISGSAGWLFEKAKLIYPIFDSDKHLQTVKNNFKCIVI